MADALLDHLQILLATLHVEIEQVQRTLAEINSALDKGMVT